RAHPYRQGPLGVEVGALSGHLVALLGQLGALDRQLRALLGEVGALDRQVDQALVELELGRVRCCRGVVIGHGPRLSSSARRWVTPRTVTRAPSAQTTDRDGSFCGSHSSF